MKGHKNKKDNQIDLLIDKYVAAKALVWGANEAGSETYPEFSDTSESYYRSIKDRKVKKLFSPHRNWIQGVLGMERSHELSLKVGKKISSMLGLSGNCCGEYRDRVVSSCKAYIEKYGEPDPKKYSDQLYFIDEFRDGLPFDGSSRGCHGVPFQ